MRLTLAKSLSLFLLFGSASAFAHTGTGVAGFLHPFSGLDHLLAMLAVGIWAAQLGGRALWFVPATFVLTMLAGGGLGMVGVTLPYIEAGILASVLVLGIAIAAMVRLPLLGSLLLVGIFALFHGNAHGLEMPLQSSVWLYSLGFAASSLFLHGLGMFLSLTLKPAGALVRLGGVAIALSGAVLAFA